jgi:putative sigma-54 modulation protein
VNIALEKLDKQVVKLREKWRDTKRHAAPPESEAAAEPAGAPQETDRQQGKKIYRVDYKRGGRKPMTLDEAIMELDGTRNGQPDYLVFRDADSDRLSVLLRRRDGNFDLIES